MKYILSIFLLALSINIAAYAQMPQGEVEELLYKNIRYTADHYGKVHGKKQNGGYVQAWDYFSGAKLWEKRVYFSDKYCDNIGKCPELFIKSLHIKDDKLYVYSEEGHVFVLFLAFPDDALDTVVGHKCIIKGMAVNLREGAAVHKDSSWIMVEELKAWPKGFEGNEVFVEGILDKLDVRPFEDERAMARGDVAGYIYTIKPANWDIIEVNEDNVMQINPVLDN